MFGGKKLADKILPDRGVHRVVGETPLGVGHVAESRSSRHKAVGRINWL
jgi:hypothetical protein